MRVLALESSGLVASVAIVEEEQLLAEYTVNYIQRAPRDRGPSATLAKLKKTHSQTLMPMLDEVVRMMEQDLEEIDAIAVAGGPGSFTGLRIGSATAKGLGLALDKPLIHIPTVDAIAYNLYGYRDLICPMMDARRNQVYTGLYTFVREDGGREVFQVVNEQMAVEVEQLIEQINQLQRPVVFLGDGVPVYRELLADGLRIPYSFAPAHLNRQRASSVGALGIQYYRAGNYETAMEHQPDYLRVSQAERERAEREKKE